ncbi:MAG: N-formylglutamate amidohydrolase [Pseudomonadota bacterium]|nr:N-formylglutamate amidohydrolase [Pseudomonadota bacterium]
MDRTPTTTRHFIETTCLVEAAACDDWDLAVGDGPVLATAIHDGHRMRGSLLPHLAFDEAQRRRDEDPLTGLLATAGDVRLRVRNSRFQSDLNRPRDKAISSDPADTWGLQVWSEQLTQPEIAASQADHDRFYTMVTALIDAVLARFGCVLLLDLHSYNHRREGPDAPAADPAGNPDIDLGVTTLDADRWGNVVERFEAALRDTPLRGKAPDVRRNVRYEGGGHFPEWVYASWGEAVCTISLEYKKVFMDEWTAQADLAALYDLRLGLERAVAAVRPEFLPCR